LQGTGLSKVLEDRTNRQCTRAPDTGHAAGGET